MEEKEEERGKRERESAERRRSGRRRASTKRSRGAESGAEGTRGSEREEAARGNRWREEEEKEVETEAFCINDRKLKFLFSSYDIMTIAGKSKTSLSRFGEAALNARTGLHDFLQWRH